MLKYGCILLLGLFLLAPSSVHANSTLYLCDSAGNLLTSDLTTSQTTLIGFMGTAMTDLAFDSAGNLYGISFSNLYRIDKETAQTTLIGPFGISGINALAFGKDGTLYAASSTSTLLYKLDPATGAATPLCDLGLPSAGDIVLIGHYLYIAAQQRVLLRVNLSAGMAVEALGLITFDFGFPVGDVYGLDTDCKGTLYGIIENTIFTLDPGTLHTELVTTYGGPIAYGCAFLKPQENAVRDWALYE